MEGLIKALIDAGGVGLLASASVLVNAVLWIALDSTRKALIEEVRRSAAALYASTDALKEANVGRDAMASAVKALESVQQLSLGRIERIAALVERLADRTSR